MALKLGVVVFSGADRAVDVLDGFHTLHPGADWAENIGIIERRRLGRIFVHGSFGHDSDWEQEQEEGDKSVAGVSIGGITGLLLGAVAGPPGLAIGGALGALIGSTVASPDEHQEDEPLHSLIRARLSKDSSALVLLADGDKVDMMVAGTREGARHVFVTEIRDELRGRLDQALREAALQRGAPQPGAPAVH
jgi:uncharacterized membrane protein